MTNSPRYRANIPDADFFQELVPCARVMALGLRCAVRPKTCLRS